MHSDKIQIPDGPINVLVNPEDFDSEYTLAVISHSTNEVIAIYFHDKERVPYVKLLEEIHSIKPQLLEEYKLQLEEHLIPNDAPGCLWEYQVGGYSLSDDATLLNGEAYNVNDFFFLDINKESLVFNNVKMIDIFKLINGI
jgi:hypothetical protein